jgi:hypothetical protein
MLREPHTGCEDIKMFEPVASPHPRASHFEEEFQHHFIRKCL